ncbi:RNase HII [Poseidonocella pacifica]|uniref:Ribonuclease HII n=1 Tax=Poseidonocella pacifica TaxID=871651 RepID=A0A1I0XVW8_9RHOB|nr:ribonuclease HII [Poseidonocella pacifica]SFB05054.1 RNase HII [Poseidonocella pacifica]
MTGGLPDYLRELGLMGAGAQRVAGVDEAGRGPLAGPVVAAAVVLDPLSIPEGLNDSKKLSAKRRAELCEEIRAKAFVGVGEASVQEIDSINILRASHLAMMRALAALSVRPDHALIDGKMLPREINLPATGIVRGDANCLSIAAASIVAKCVRDEIMRDLAQQFPGYGWETNKGYPSKSHKLALQNLGVTPHHRHSFKPVHNILYQQ